MGEARQRKQSDANYGKYSNTVRGLVISPPIIIDGGAVHIKNAGLDPQELRSSLLYWDRLALPLSNVIRISGGIEADYLESCGIMERKMYFATGNGADCIVNAQIQALSELERRAPGAWSLGGGENSILAMGGVARMDAGTALQLYNCLPTPKENTSLSDILEFKQRRRPELLTFRAYMDALCTEISNSNDSVDELNKKLALLDAACSDLIKTTKEFSLPVYLSNLSASLNFDSTKVLGTASSVWFGANKIGLGITTSTIATFIATTASMISLKSDIKFQPMRRPSSPFKYVYLAQRDL